MDFSVPADYTVKVKEGEIPWPCSSVQKTVEYGCDSKTNQSSSNRNNLQDFGETLVAKEVMKNLHFNPAFWLHTHTYANIHIQIFTYKYTYECFKMIKLQSKI